MKNRWTRLRSVMSLTSQWVDLHCETWRKPGGEVCEYWRVEKPDALIVIPVYDSRFLLPEPDYRPGVGRCTLDFPGGRMDHSEGANIEIIAKRILLRELGLDESNIARVVPIDTTGIIINSSFSNQRLLLAAADLSHVDGIAGGVKYYSLNETDRLLQELECLQCA